MSIGMIGMVAGRRVHCRRRLGRVADLGHRLSIARGRLALFHRRRLLERDDRSVQDPCRHLSGVMNTGANVGGVISPSLTPWLADHWGWTASLLFAAFIALCGGVMWMRIDAGRKLGSEVDRNI